MKKNFKQKLMLAMAVSAALASVWLGSASTYAANSLATMAWNTASWSITTAWDIMATDVGTIIYFVVWLWILSLVIWVILFWVSRRGK